MPSSTSIASKFASATEAYAPPTINVVFNDTWGYDVDANAWTDLMPAAPPETRYNAAGSVFQTGSLLLYSGKPTSDTSDPIQGVSAYDPEANAWSELVVVGEPAARFSHVMVHVGNSNKAIVFGGATEDGEISSALDETWEFTGPAL